jgi:hypothetical protein
MLNVNSEQHRVTRGIHQQLQPGVEAVARDR